MDGGIYSYTRKEALADGLLIDITEMARKCCIKYPTAFTASVWEIINDIPPNSGQDVNGRLWNILCVLRVALIRASSNTIHFTLPMDRASTQGKTLELKAVIGPGDDAAPVITIMLLDED
jgi:hypothetical protein